MITKAEAERIVEAEKVIGQQIAWKLVHPTRQNYLFRVPVIAPNMPDVNLAFAGQWQQSNWGFNLLGPSNEAIRRISDPDHDHRIRATGEQVDGRHKHFWVGPPLLTDHYFPDDIRWDDANEAFADFLVECRITLLGTFPERPLFHKELPHGI